MNTHPGESAPIRAGGTGSPTRAARPVVVKGQSHTEATVPVRNAPAPDMVSSAGARRGKPRPSGKRISEAEFRRMWADLSLSVTQIGERLGIGQTAVSSRAATRGLPARPKRGGRKVLDPEALSRLWLARVGISDIAAALGCDPKTVRNTRKRLGLPARNPGRWKETVSLDDYRAEQLRRAMERSAREERAALRNAEMIDRNRRAPQVAA